MYRLLALDMDGTLLNSRKEISPVTLEALKRLVSRGIAVALCTGRGIAELDGYASELSFVPYGILNSGGCIYDFMKKRPLCQKLLDDEVLLQCLRAAKAVRAMPYLLFTDVSAGQTEDLRDVSVFRMGIYQSLYDRIATAVPDLEEYVKSRPASSLKLCIFHRDEDTRNVTRAAVSRFDLQLSDAETTSLEISPPGVTKALGLQFLCDYLDIPIEETVAVGDADNDLDVLKAAGLSVAMGNANDRVKQLCDVQVADNDHDGIAEVIDRFF